MQRCAVRDALQSSVFENESVGYDMSAHHPRSGNVNVNVKDNARREERSWLWVGVVLGLDPWYNIKCPTVVYCVPPFRFEAKCCKA